MAEVTLWLSALEAQKTFGISRFAIQRLALRGEIAFKILPGGRTRFAADDVHRLASERALRRNGRAPVSRLEPTDRGAA